MCEYQFRKLLTKIRKTFRKSLRKILAHVKRAVNEKDLAENVKKFPVLYGKSNDEFHKNDIRKNAWTKVAESIGIEYGRLCLQ